MRNCLGSNRSHDGIQGCIVREKLRQQRGQSRGETRGDDSNDKGQAQQQIDGLPTLPPACSRGNECECSLFERYMREAAQIPDAVQRLVGRGLQPGQCRCRALQELQPLRVSQTGVL